MKKLLVQPNRSSNLCSPTSNSVSNGSRIIEEIVRLFNDGGDFYTVPSGNLTQSLQRCVFANNVSKCNIFVCSYQDSKLDEFDERFFWNRHLLRDLFTDGESGILPSNEFVRHWLVPIVQGYVAERQVTIADVDSIMLTLISRRSIRRAGVRYVKRGIDDNGDVANFVETEQIISMFGHNLSFVQVFVSKIINAKYLDNNFCRCVDRRLCSGVRAAIAIVHR